MSKIFNKLIIQQKKYLQDISKKWGTHARSLRTGILIGLWIQTITGSMIDKLYLFLFLKISA